MGQHTVDYTHANVVANRLNSSSSRVLWVAMCQSGFFCFQDRLDTLEEQQLQAVQRQNVRPEHQVASILAPNVQVALGRSLAKTAAESPSLEEPGF